MNPPDSCEDLLRQMVAFDTVNERYGGRPGGETDLACWLESLAREWGLNCRRYPVSEPAFNLLIAFAPHSSGAWILLESHLDTVGVSGMTIQPFELTAKEDRLYARGACDTKGSGAAMLWALRAVQKSRSAPCNVGVLFTVDEEAGMTGASTFSRTELPRWPGPLRGIVVGEPTELHPVIAHNGVVRWTTVTHGLAAHSSDPSKGRSAISDMVKIIGALDENYLPAARLKNHPLTGNAACSINVIRGGTQVNVIPDRCEIEVDRRIIPGETAEGALAGRDAALLVLQQQDAPIRFEHLPPYIVPPLSPEPNRAFLQNITPVLTRHGIEPVERGARYVTNASHYAAAGIPTIVLGPGNIAQAHTADEWLARDQLIQAVKVYTGIMES
ncbi:acetylornithine deacetylase [Nibricoccus aquaticus]|uniref:Acetylornithine deacetylase n=1 Tax=Nibricoccus aquaticus TaxID=2576891 RepID=A0A290QED8_9BACT|nr:M20 family metallopeptidase [Nibricoccus aquaticus]ATC64626.1 acetylornithine deacetylase [Nibricoccus aquaticus]